MSTPSEILRRDLPPDLDPSERERLVALASRLQADPPSPTPAFRGNLRRELRHASAGRRVGVNPPAVPALSLSCVASGLLLLAIATIGLTGVGPFAAG